MAATEELGPGDRNAMASEDELIRRARRGDPAAWEALVRHHQEHVYRLAYLTLRDTAEAEDMAQETFLRAFLALERFELGRPLRPWLTRIAINQARNRRRSLGRYLHQLRQAFSGEPEPERVGVAPERNLQVRWRAAMLREAVQRLSRSKQEVLHLRFFLAMPEAEMAEALNVPPGTVKSRLHRAMASLRQTIEADFPELQELFEEE